MRGCPAQSRFVGDSCVHAPTALQSPLGAAYKAPNCAGNPELVISGQEGVGCEQFGSRFDFRESWALEFSQGSGAQRDQVGWWQNWDFIRGCGLPIPPPSTMSPLELPES